MQSLFNHYVMIAKRWIWLIVLGIVLCGGITYVISKFISPVYQASATIVVNADPTSSESVPSSIAAVPTYTQLLANPLILDPVLANHHDLTLQQLNSMISTKSVAGTQLIELDVTNRNAQLAKQLADEIGQSFAQYSNSQLPGTVQILPARIPDTPIRPRPLLDAGIGALVGLGLAITMIVIFEWLADRFSSPREVQELLHSEILMNIPHLSDYSPSTRSEENPVIAEGCYMLCSILNTAQANKHIKSVMVTSALESEGKSSIAKHIASFLAMAGKRVLLVDANVHRPVLHQYFNLSNQRGFSNIFQEMHGWSEVERYIQGTEIADLHILTAGVQLSNYGRLLQSRQANQFFKYFNHSPFDYVLFDTPPLLEEANAKLLACNIQTAILVVDPSKTARQALRRAESVLSKTNTVILGAVINNSYWSESRDFYPGSLKQTQIESPIIINTGQPIHTHSTSPPVASDDAAKLNSRLPIVDIHQETSSYDSHAPQTDK